MNRKVPRELVEALVSGKLFCILGHAEPDGDCVGSQVALGHFLSRLGGEVHLLSPGPFQRPEIVPFASRFELAMEPALRERRPLVVVVDCSALERIGDFAASIGGLTTIVIDHHSSGRGFGDLTYIDPTSPSVTLLVERVISSMGGTPDETEARMLFFGLGTDTGFFRHLDARDPDVYEAMARLNGAGATPKQIYEMIYSGKPLASRILLGRALSRTEALFDGRVLSTYETIEDMRTFGAESRDSDSLYQLLQATGGCEAVILIREEDERTCSVGLRANGGIDVGAIAGAFGGGGHKKAAGFEWTGSREAIKELLLRELSALFRAP